MIQEAQAAIDRLNNMTEDSDQEIAHSNADEVLLDFIRDIQYPEVAKAYEEARERIGFWYA